METMRRAITLLFIVLAIFACTLVGFAVCRAAETYPYYDIEIIDVTNVDDLYTVTIVWPDGQAHNYEYIKEVP